MEGSGVFNALTIKFILKLLKLIFKQLKLASRCSLKLTFVRKLLKDLESSFTKMTKNGFESQI